ncbi:MAG: Flagellum-specific synthase [Pseudomonadota bacterium]
MRHALTRFPLKAVADLPELLKTDLSRNHDRCPLPPLHLTGRVTKVAGTSIEVEGLRSSIGSQCSVFCSRGTSRVDAEVIGFSDTRLFLMPYKSVDGLAPGCRVQQRPSNSQGRLTEALVGRVLDGFGEPLDGGLLPPYHHFANLDGKLLNPMQRPPITTILETGIKAIDTCLTLGRGQRLGLIAGSGVGKSVLLGMLARNTKADVVVIGLIGERGREVQEFISRTLGRRGLQRSVVIAAPANASPLERIRAAKLTHLIAEYFRDRGDDVLMLFDSLTRVAHAQREIGLAVGEPPTTKGYPPSVFSLLPNLIERPGMGINGTGSITSFYTVLAEGDDRNDPIVDIARASLDGQVMLSRALADKAHYPAIDLAGSVSRVANNLLDPDRTRLAQRLRRLWSLYSEKEDLIHIGAYEAKSSAEVDEAIRVQPLLSVFLRQQEEERFDYEDSWGLLRGIVR